MTERKHYNLKGLLSENDFIEMFSGIKIGFEKESLRLAKSTISKTSHPRSLGAAICNSFITTDFSEAQLELITPPSRGNADSLSVLDDIHHFVLNNIGEEMLWPLSVPPSVHSHDDIRIAEFGSSHEGVFKHVYRLGLANRYGKSRQTISGFHFNYSLPERMYKLISRNEASSLSEIRSNIYFNILRNIYQMNWLLIYLFGASPVIDKSIVQNNKDPFREFDKDSLFLPYATSLRMSEYGYSNIGIKEINVSVNSLDEYISDLRLATTTEEPEYLKHNKKKYSQLNSNILQIEAEYYAVARAKSISQKARRTTTNLKHGGVDFIEIRSLDLNPFSSIGIDREAILFLEVFMILCLIEPARKIGKAEMKMIKENDSVVAKYGRKSNISLMSHKGKVLMKDLGNNIFEKMIAIAELLDNKDCEYTTVIASMKSRLKNSDETLSARMIDEIEQKKISHHEFGLTLAEEYKEKYLKLKIAENTLWKKLEAEKTISHSKQQDLERKTIISDQTFEEFKQDYYES